LDFFGRKFWEDLVIFCHAPGIHLMRMHDVIINPLTCTIKLLYRRNFCRIVVS
jgi:hypothetical protein